MWPEGVPRAGVDGETHTHLPSLGQQVGELEVVLRTEVSGRFQAGEQRGPMCILQSPCGCSWDTVGEAPAGGGRAGWPWHGGEWAGSPEVSEEGMAEEGLPQLGAAAKSVSVLKILPFSSWKV